MVTLVICLIAGLVFIFACVVLFGAPYVPTLTPQVEAAFMFLNLKKGDTLLELGCGDGKVLVAAGERGIKAVGYELNPLLALIAWVRVRKYKGNIQVVWGNYWQKEWPLAQGIYVFLLDKYMAKLDKYITQNYKYKPVKLVSFAFAVPGKAAKKQQTGLHLYEYK